MHPIILIKIFIFLVCKKALTVDKQTIFNGLNCMSVSLTIENNVMKCGLIDVYCEYFTLQQSIYFGMKTGRSCMSEVIGRGMGPSCLPPIHLI